MLGMCQGTQGSTHFFVNLFVSCTVCKYKHCTAHIKPIKVDTDMCCTCLLMRTYSYVCCMLSHERFIKLESLSVVLKHFWHVDCAHASIAYQLVCFYEDVFREYQDAHMYKCQLKDLLYHTSISSVRHTYVHTYVYACFAQ